MKINKEFNYKIISFSIVVIGWFILSLLFPPIIIPSIQSVLIKLVEILSDYEMLNMIFLTTIRLLLGLVVGISIGLILGFAMGYKVMVKNILLPIINLFQTIPPVTWVVLALVWFGINSKPAIFIVIISTIPIIAINIMHGIENLDPKLLEMSEIFKFDFKKKLQHVIMPGIYPYFVSAFKIVLASGWKIVVMGEVLTINDGIGGMFKLARLNIESDTIFAWAIIIVVLYYLSEFLVNKLLDRKKGVA